MISGDKNILTPGSAVRARLELQRSQVNRLDVFSYQGVTSALRGFLEIAHAISCNKYDVITVQEPSFRGLLAFMAARRARARLNVQVHIDLAHEPLLKRIITRFVFRRADSVRVVSEKLAAQVRALAPQARVSVLPIYVNTSRFKDLASTPHARKTILWVGRFEQEKDPIRALEILESVRKAGIDAKLVMLGSGSLEPSLRRAAEGLPVEFPGWRDPLPYLQVADVVLSTSRAESWGASLVEALAASVPVVAPDVGIAREAGAIIAERSRFAEEVVRVLRSGERGELKLSLPGAEEWAILWKQTL